MAKLRKYGATSRKTRRMDAEKRQEYYKSLTPQQKLDRLPINGESKKEIRKLTHLIKFGRKFNEAATPSKTKKMKDAKPSRRERWEENRMSILYGDSISKEVIDWAVKLVNRSCTRRLGILGKKDTWHKTVRFNLK